MDMETTGAIAALLLAICGAAVLADQKRKSKNKDDEDNKKGEK